MDNGHYLKGTVNPKIKALSFTYPHVVPNVYDFIYSFIQTQNEMRQVESQPWSPFTFIAFFSPFNGNKMVPASVSHFEFHLKKEIQVWNKTKVNK